MTDLCPICEGAGIRILVRPDHSRVARDCECMVEKRQRRALTSAHIPPLYESSTFLNFETEERDNKTYTLNNAKYTAEKFVSAYPADTNGVGLLLTGPAGSGKTHLAVSILRSLIERGASGLFYHFHDLNKEIQNSFNRSVQTTESDVLKPILNAQILVLDELGATKPSAWVFDTIAQILNTRYNERRTTIVTTNYRNSEATLTANRVLSVFEESREALRNESLGDRIGERMRSRLQEMCIVVEMNGPDYRANKKRARLA